MAGTRDTPCSDCDGKEKTLYVAIVANAKGERYAVCVGCYRKQWLAAYGKDEKCPV